MKVLVTNCVVNSALSAMRSLHDEGAEVIGAVSRQLPFGLHSRCTPPYEQLSPTTSAGFLDSLIAVLAKHKPDVLLPFGAAAECSRAREVLSRLTGLLVPEFDAFRALDDKLLLVDQCKKSAIRTPELLDIAGAARTLESGRGEVIVVKPRRNLGGGMGVSFVRSAEALNRAVDDIKNRFGEPLLFEYISGPDSANIAMQIVLDRDSRLVGHFGLQKNRIQPPHVGVTAAGTSVHRPDLLRLVLPLLRRIQWQGPADIEFKIDSRTGEPWLIEINARFSGSVGFATACGVNLPLISCRAALGEELPESTTPSYRSGVKYWNPIMYVRAIAAAVRLGAPPKQLLSQIYDELRGERVGSPYRLSDPGPLVGKALSQIVGRFSHRSGV